MRHVLVLLVLGLPAIASAQPDAPTEPPPPPTPTPTPVPPADPVEACKAQRHELSERAAQTTDLQERARLLQSMPDCGALAPAPPLAPIAPAIAPEAVSATGFALEVRMETVQFPIDNNTVLPTTSAGIFLGYRTPSYTVGAGFDIQRVGESSASSGQPSNDSNVTTLMIMPGVRFPFARSADARVELLGVADLGFGILSQGNNQSMGTSTPDVKHVRAQGGLGLRYWVAPAFAVGGTAGLRFDWFGQSMDDGIGGTIDRTQTVLAVFSSIQLTGVF